MFRFIFFIFLMILTVTLVGQPGAEEVAAVAPVSGNEWFTAIIACLLAVSEALAYIPFLKSNSILQLIINILKMMKGNRST